MLTKFDKLLMYINHVGKVPQSYCLCGLNTTISKRLEEEKE